MDEKLEAKVEKAIQKWMAENSTEEEIYSYVSDMLTKQRYDMVARLAGFSNTWGKWEVDWSSSYPIAQMLKKTVEDSIRAWFASHPMPALSDAQETLIFNEYKRLLVQEMKYRARETAVQVAEEEFSKLVRQKLGIEEEE